MNDSSSPDPLYSGPSEGLDSPEDIDRRRVFERLQGSLLKRKAELVRVAKYVVGKRIGRGASGAVFVAHDGELHRDVALKLLRLDTQVDPRRLEDHLMREARALARMSHPNVVHVYEAGRHGTNLFIAMELIEGESVERWQRTKRPWQEIVEVYRLAGEGLAEAHHCGVVHKDFKPGNVMLRHEPRRVCVTDFGLARLMKDEQATTQREGETPDLDGPVATATVGFTPAYAPPEQLLGGVVDARSDQYAFCVALFEALLGELPFAGDDLRTLVTNKAEGHVVPFQRGDVPERIVRAIRRGLEVDPGRRHASMRALLAELEPRPRGTSRPWIIGAAVLGVSLAAAVWASRPKDSEPCSRYVEAASERWNPAARERVREAFVATGLPYATTVAATVSADLDAHVARWIDESTSACLDRVPREGVELRGGTPAAERSRCLDRRLRDIGRLVERLEQVTPGDVSLVDRAYELVAELPPLDDCTEREPPATTIDPAQLVALDEALGATHVAMTLADWEAAERHAEHARTLAVELALEPEELEATIGLGRAQLESEEPQRGRATLEAAARRAEALGDDRLAWLGWVHLAQLAFEERSYRPQAGMWLAKAESAGSRLEGELRRKRLEFEWANLGLLEDDDAIPQLMGVWGWLEGHGEQLGDFKIATGMSLAALLLASEDAVQAVPYAHEAMRLAEQRRGASHPSTVMARLDLGMGMIQQCLLEDAEVELRSADAGAEALGHVADRARILLALAQIYFYTGRAEEAKALLAAADPLVGPDDPELVPSLVISRGVVAFAEGRLEDAADHFERAAQRLDAAESPAAAALARAMVGESRLYTGGVTEAAALAEAARRELEDAPPGTLGIALKVAGLAALHEGRTAEAVEMLEGARAQTVQCDRPELADIDLGLAVALTAVGRAEDAASRQTDAEAAFAALGAPGAARRARLEAFLAGARRPG